MIIALILWRIKNEHKDEFVRKWKDELVINDRSNLVGEFLSEPIQTQDERLRTLKLSEIGEPSPDKVVLMNVGIWASVEDFQKQVGRYIDDSQKRPYEYEIRLRLLLDPVAWRLGDAVLPNRDTAKTF